MDYKRRGGEQQAATAVPVPETIGRWKTEEEAVSLSMANGQYRSLVVVFSDVSIGSGMTLLQGEE